MDVYIYVHVGTKRFGVICTKKKHQPCCTLIKVPKKLEINSGCIGSNIVPDMEKFDFRPQVICQS